VNRVLRRLQTQFDEQLGGIGGLLADGGHLCRSAAVKFSSTSAAGSLRPAGDADAHSLKSVVPKRPAVN
jgi:hypothetical protein